MMVVSIYYDRSTLSPRGSGEVLRGSEAADFARWELAVGWGTSTSRAEGSQVIPFGDTPTGRDTITLPGADAAWGPSQVGGGGSVSLSGEADVDLWRSSQIAGAVDGGSFEEDPDAMLATVEIMTDDVVVLACNFYLGQDGRLPGDVAELVDARQLQVASL